MYHKLARRLRRRMTDDERKLWRELRNRNFGSIKFRRQQPVGPYIVDFISFEAKLIIELDGTQHSEQDRRSADEVRTRFLESQGFRVLRYWNNEVFKEFDAVLSSIYHETWFGSSNRLVSNSPLVSHLSAIGAMIAVAVADGRSKPLWF